jgi:UDP-glucuronate 4-epimerase
LSLCANGNARFRLQTPGQRPGGPKAISYQFPISEVDLRDGDRLRDSLDGRYDVVVHIAAKAGVRPSIENPLEYQDVNVRGTHGLLELCRTWGVRQFVFASSSSVHGVNPRVPWSEADHVLLSISPYASTKVSGELLGHVFASLFGIRFLALRFFTVYGPRQRPDLAIRKFSQLMLAGKPSPVFGAGNTRRDYTYADDVFGQQWRTTRRRTKSSTWGTIAP